MDKIKIAFFDIDGTILEFEHKEITDKMRETLNQLQKNGIIICIATGRAPLTLPHFDGVDFDAYLTFNGSDELKAVADDVCGDVAEDGIYYYCKKHKLI